MKPALVQDAFKVGEVGALVVVDEDKVERSLVETECASQSVDGRSGVAKRSPNHGQSVTDARVSPDPAGDFSIRRAVLDREQPGVRWHDPGDPQPAVAAICPQLEQQSRRAALDRLVEDLTLLVAYVDHHAASRTEVVDHADGVVEVARAGMRENVVCQRLLAPIANLPVAVQAAHAEEHS